MSRVICTDYYSDPKDARQGFACFYSPKMLQTIRHCPVFMKNGRRWIGMPSYWRDFEKEGIEGYPNKYAMTVEFDPPLQAEFLRLALKAVDTYCLDKNGSSVFKDGELDI